MTTTLRQPCSVDSVRPLGGLEHFFSLIDQHHPVHFAMAAQIKGHASVAEWRTALDKLQQRHPMLSVAIEFNNDHAPCFRASREIRIPLRVTSGPTVSRWEEEVAQELAAPFDSRQAPLARAVLMHGQSESVFILTTHHSIADGFSSAYAIRDVLRALAGETLEPLLPIPAMEPLVYTSQQATQKANGSQQPDVPDNGRPVRLRTTGGLPSIEALRLTPQLTRTLIERARQERTTVHGALCSALVLAGRECFVDWKHSPVRVMSPFSLRKELAIGEDCGLFIWSGSVSMDHCTLADFWEIARFATSSLTEKQSLGRVASEMNGLQQVVNSGIGVQGAAQVLTQEFPCELLLTNLGKLPIRFDTGSIRLKALWGPAVLMGFENEQTVGVTTTNDSLCLLRTSFTPLPSLLPRVAQIILHLALE